MLLGIRLAGGVPTQNVRLQLREYTSDPNDALQVIDPTDFYRFVDERPYTELTEELGDLFKEDGILIPLLVFGDSTCTPDVPVFRRALVPMKLNYRDGITGKESSIEVRRFLQTPLIISATVASRG